MNNAGRGAAGDESVEFDGESDSEDSVDASEGLRCDTCECHFSTAGDSMTGEPSKVSRLSNRSVCDNVRLRANRSRLD